MSTHTRYDSQEAFSGATTHAAASFEAQAAGKRAISAAVTGDAQRRLVVTADGKLDWGSGSATPDTNLYRSAADLLKTDDGLEVGGALTVTGALAVTGTHPGVIVCTSSTRPAHAEGRVIYETDTDRVLVSDGAAWVRIAAAAVGGRTGCRLRRAAAQSVNNTTNTPISWDTEDQDPDGFIAVTSPTVTIPAGLGGLYAITFEADAAITGRSYGEIKPTSGITGMPGDLRVYMEPLEDRVVVAVTIPLLATDSFLCNVFHSTGAAANFTGWLSCYRIGA